MSRRATPAAAARGAGLAAAAATGAAGLGLRRGSRWCLALGLRRRVWLRLGREAAAPWVLILSVTWLPLVLTS